MFFFPFNYQCSKCLIDRFSVNKIQIQVSDTYDKWNFNFYLMYHLKVIQFNLAICSFSSHCYALLKMQVIWSTSCHIHLSIFLSVHSYVFIDKTLNRRSLFFYSIYSVKYLTIDSPSSYSFIDAFLAGSFFFSSSLTDG